MIFIEFIECIKFLIQKLISFLVVIKIKKVVDNISYRSYTFIVFGDVIQVKLVVRTAITVPFHQGLFL